MAAPRRAQPDAGARRRGALSPPLDEAGRPGAVRRRRRATRRGAAPRRRRRRRLSPARARPSREDRVILACLRRDRPGSARGGRRSSPTEEGVEATVLCLSSPTGSTAIGRRRRTAPAARQRNSARRTSRRSLLPRAGLPSSRSSTVPATPSPSSARRSEPATSPSESTASVRPVSQPEVYAEYGIDARPSPQPALAALEPEPRDERRRQVST